LEREAMRAEPNPLELAIRVARCRVAARALPGVLGPALGHFVLAGIPAQRDPQVRVVSVIDRPSSHQPAHRGVVFAVQVGVAKLVAVRWIEKHGAGPAAADVLALPRASIGSWPCRRAYAACASP